jgi:CheY-like chemotaxis protein
VESGKFEFFPEPIDLGVLIREVIDILHTSIQRKQIRLSVDIDLALASLELDPARLKQVLYNYLSNAIKFTPEGGAIAVRAMADGPLHFRLEVEDNGIGIAASDLPRLFNDFQQLDAGYTKQHQGTGLGLALTRRLVRAQGGSVGVRSTPGQGSVFFLVLNRHDGTDAPIDATGLAPAAATASAATSVLVIDDDGQRQSRIVRDLSEAGFRVDVATTGEQALRRARGRAYDAITLDLMMPDLGGLAVLDSIRGEGASRASPVVSVSMPVDDGTTATFAIANVLSKPIRVDEVVASMARFRAGAAGRPNVLVIDDDTIALELMRATLLGLGIEAVCVADGREALRDIGRHRPDAIILDLMMPGFDGFEVLDALRQLPDWRDTPVFIWTSMILTVEESASLSRSAQAILGKGGGELAVMLDALRRWRPTGVLLEGPAS